MEKKIEKIYSRPARPGMVGDGFRVFNYFPNNGISQQRISPFLLMDFNAEYDFGPSDHLRGVDVHPHKGFETVTIVYEVPGIRLTVLGKSVEPGGLGDSINVLNVESKRTVQATVTGPSRVTVNAGTRLTADAAP